MNGLTVRVMEAGEPGAPVLLLLHGFPELAWSWRRLALLLADAGYHVVAPDQRGFGGTSGADCRYDGDLAQFRQMNLAQDAIELLFALGLEKARAVIGHDFGSSVAAHCALVRPDLFETVVLMSAPFGGPPPARPSNGAGAEDPQAALAALNPPRKHYVGYFSTREADADMRLCAQGLFAFLRGYFHVKSADWPGNRPHPLAGWTADELAKLPDYYVMPLGATMPEAVAPYMPSAEQIAACDWLTDEDLRVFVDAFARTGFQGGLNWYRCVVNGWTARDLRLFAGRRIEIPALFVAGEADWGMHQSPGVMNAMATRACADFRGARIIPGAGHWVQQEQPEAVAKVILSSLGS